MSSTSPLMDIPVNPMISSSTTTTAATSTDENHLQTCDSPSGSSTSEPHDDALMNLQQPSLVDQSFFYKLDQLSPDNPLYFMQQQQQLQQQQQQHQSRQLSPPYQQQPQNYSISPVLSSPSDTQHTGFVDPLLPGTNAVSPGSSSHNTNNNNDSNPTFWTGFNNAIPNLAKNFTDYVSGGGGYPMQQPQTQQQQPTSPFNNSQSHLSPNTPSQDISAIPSNTTAQDSLTGQGMQIRVLGVPQTGAKSRVETQIKICLQLVTDNGDKAQWWSHLKLPEYMVAKDKLKRQIVMTTSPNGKQIANVPGLDNSTIKPEKMLFLSARVVCASDPSRKVVTCLGCIQRERKRTQRRKENKMKQQQQQQQQSVESDDNIPSSSNNSSNGESNATSSSLALEEQKVLLFNCSEIVDFSSGDIILPTRITCYCRHHNERLGFCIYFEMHDHTGKSVATGMSPPIMITDDHKSNKIKTGRKRFRVDNEKPSNTPILSSSLDIKRLQQQQQQQQHHQQPIASASTVNAGFVSTTNNQFNHLQPIQPQQTQQQQQRLNFPSPPHHYNIQPRPSAPTTPTAAFPEHKSSPNGILSVQNTNTMTTAIDSSNNHSSSVNQNRPLLQRLIPNEGPTFGGVEVTLLGSGFKPGLTCMFGDVAASSTHYWSPNTLVCILPPASEAGTVVVSFKEHPLMVDSSQDVTLFTYYNENDRALMELALQVVGLKMTGKVEDARDIAMRIVQGGGSGTNGGSSSQNESNSNNAATTNSQLKDLELHIIQVLEVMRTFRDVQTADVSLTSPQGHTMLHLAAMLGFNQLTQVLIDLGCQVNTEDKNGLTALHYAAWFKHESVVHTLLDYGCADPDILNRWNKKPLDLTESQSIRHMLWNHVPVMNESDFSDSDINDDSYSSCSTDKMNADVDTSFEEDSDSEYEDDSSVWLSDAGNEEEEGGDEEELWQQQDQHYSYESDSEESIQPYFRRSMSFDDSGLRHRRTNRSLQQQQQHPTIHYLNEFENSSLSADEILDAEPVHAIDHILAASSDFDEDEIIAAPQKSDLSWMQRTLSHFQQQQQTDNHPTFIQNIKNNISAKPTDLTLKTITDHLLVQFPRPATMIANMSQGLFGNNATVVAHDSTAAVSSEKNRGNDKGDEPAADQTLAWYMALAYAMGARSLTEQQQQITNDTAATASSIETNSSASSTPTLQEQQQQQEEAEVVAKKQRDKRLFSFWVPMLCLMVIWLIWQFISSHPGIADSFMGISGFRRQYLSIR